MKRTPKTAALLAFATATAFATLACDRKEKVLDVDTPGGGIEVERDKDTGAIDVEVEDKE